MSRRERVKTIVRAGSIPWRTGGAFATISILVLSLIREVQMTLELNQARP